MTAHNPIGFWVDRYGIATPCYARKTPSWFRRFAVWLLYDLRWEEGAR